MLLVTSELISSWIRGTPAMSLCAPRAHSWFRAARKQARQKSDQHALCSACLISNYANDCAFISDACLKAWSSWHLKLSFKITSFPLGSVDSVTLPQRWLLTHECAMLANGKLPRQCWPFWRTGEPGRIQKALVLSVLHFPLLLNPRLSENKLLHNRHETSIWKTETAKNQK